VCRAEKLPALEDQWGEAGWPRHIVTVAERFIHGAIAVAKAGGFGIELNDVVICRQM
jgi:hypothetical protein